jgi:hypothetical protein
MPAVVFSFHPGLLFQDVQYCSSSHRASLTVISQLSELMTTNEKTSLYFLPIVQLLALLFAG